MRTLKLLTHTWWLTIPKPRMFSLGWGMAYLMLGLSGIDVLLRPPLHELAPGGFPAVLTVTIVNTLGMFFAMAFGWADYWKGERLGIAFMLGAAALYGWLIATKQLTADGGLPLYILFAIIVLGVRYLMIRWYTYRPRES